MFKQLWHDENGASMTEYSLLVALVGMAAYTLIKFFGKSIQDIFEATKKPLGEAKNQVGKP